MPPLLAELDILAFYVETSLGSLKIINIVKMVNFNTFVTLSNTSKVQFLT